MENQFVLLLGCQKDVFVEIELDCFEDNEIDQEFFEDFVSRLTKHMSVDEDDVSILPPQRFDELKQFESDLQTLFCIYDIIILVDLTKNHSYLYKGPDIDRIKKIYLPRFFEMFNIMYGEDVFLEKVEDIRAVYSIKYLYNINNN